MATVKAPERLFSFTDWTKAHPREPIPGDRLDSQIFELIDAIKSTQDALAQIRRDDGQLHNASVGENQLVAGLRAELIGDVAKDLAPITSTAKGSAAAALDAERNAQLYAQDAEKAVRVVQQLVTAWDQIRFQVEQQVNHVTAMNVTFEELSAENWGNYAKAQADNAIAAKEEALQWAEYLAGPVVNAAEAPDYIANSHFPNGYFYGPVAGSPGGLWSAKWWAIQALNIVGTMSFFYVGTWDHPPVPGEQHPTTGLIVPNPIPIGSLYFDSGTGKLYAWDGSSWVSTHDLAPAYVGSFHYNVTTAGQTTFSGPDANGATPIVGSSPSEVYVNGVRLVPIDDFHINSATNTLTLDQGVGAGGVVIWDLMTPSSALAPSAINAYKILALTPDGTTTDFLLQFINPSTGLPEDANVGNGAQLMVSLDGIIQEPGGDYTSTGNMLHMAVAPVASAKLWVVWYKPMLA